ncbi:MAG: hypothetical protein IT440_01540 [Phycisphaeraceae bacterium]|nr:hypothetical protein [Phycisphaeraceae bacterium]
MNHRERFNAIMHYQPFDRGLLYDFSYWEETLPEWQKQGLPKSVDPRTSETYFGMDMSLGSPASPDSYIHVSIGLCPPFVHKVIEDRGEFELVQDGDGVRLLRQKYMGSIPMHEGHLLVDRASWKKHYKPKLDPTSPKRWVEDIKQQAKRWTDPKRDYPIFLPGCSLYGWIRNWMGMEGASMMVYDDPALFEEMVVTIADLNIAMLTPVLETRAKFEAWGGWEDMCYNAGPLLSPEHFKQYLVPNYRRITDLLHKYGVDIIWTDCDGKIDDLIPLWMEAGVNTMFPIEIGTWGADPVKYRKQYGRDLLLMGGVDKHALQGGPAAIDAEVKRLTPLVEEGGFIPMPDHRVPPDVTLANWVYYIKAIRKAWGRNLDLKPMDPSINGLPGVK